MKRDLAEKFKLSFDFVIEIVFLVMVFLSPIIFDRRVGIVFSGTKVAWMRALMVILLSVWAAKIMITRKHRFIRTPLDWPIMAFIFTTTIATISSIHLVTSFAGFYGRFEGLSTWYIFALLFFVAANFIHSNAQLKRIILLVVAAATSMSVYSLFQRHNFDSYQWGGVITWQRVIGTIGQPNFLAAYVIMAFFLGLILLLEEKKYPAKIDWRQQLIPLFSFIVSQAVFVVMIKNIIGMEMADIIRWYFGFTLITISALIFAFYYDRLHPLILEILIGACLFLMYVCLLYTQSRGGYMGFFAGAVLFTAVAGRHLILNNWKKLGFLGVAIIVISVATMVQPEFSPFERFTSEITVNKEDASIAKDKSAKNKLEFKGAAGSRGETWKSVFKVIADNPLFGIGPEVLKMVFPRYETDLFRFKETFHVKQDRCHNETMDVPVTKGMISFALYLWIIFLLFSVGLKKAIGADSSQRLVCAGILAAVLAYLIQNQFSFGVIAITSLFWVLWGMLMKTGCQEKSDDSKIQIKAADIPWLSFAGLVAALAALLYFSFASFRSDIHFRFGKECLERGMFQNANDELTKSLSALPFEGTTISHLAIANLNMGNIDNSIKVLMYGIKVDPYNADNFQMLSRYYIALHDQGMKGALQEAEKATNNAIIIDPYYAEAFQAMGMVFERKGEKKKAAQMYKKAYMINPTLNSAIADYERVDGRQGAIKVVEAVYNKYPDFPAAMSKMGSIFLERNDFYGLEKIANKLIMASPKTADGYIYLGAVKHSKGDNDSAFNLFQQAVMLEPQNPAAHAWLARSYREKGNFEREKEELDLIRSLAR